MNRILLVGLVGLLVLVTAAGAVAQKDPDAPTALLKFIVIKEDNGKPVRNAAVIMHPVSSRGKQGHGGMELKTDADGKSSFDGIPYGRLRVQVLASGFQTYGEDFEINQPSMSFTIKLKRPQSQYSIYEDHSKDSPPPKQDAPPPADKSSDKKSDKPNSFLDQPRLRTRFRNEVQAMDYLLKTEPSTYSFADLEREKITLWDGVSNPVALKYLRGMKPGERLVIYHTGDEKSAVGSATVVSVDASDARNPQVKIKVGQPNAKPMSLAEVKASKLFADSPLVRQGRLSVVPLNDAQYKFLTGE